MVVEVAGSLVMANEEKPYILYLMLEIGYSYLFDDPATTTFGCPSGVFALNKVWFV
jgi:hypothetical protein